MKREPNPYAKQRTYTVTQTMAISVPSVVAEDVLDGVDMPSTSVDPAINGRIDAISEVVDLMDTRIDAVSDMTSLLNDSIYDVSAELSGRIDVVSEVLALHGSGSSSPISTLSGFSGSDAHYNQSTGLDYKLGLGLTYDTHQAYLIVKNGDSAEWQPLQLESGSSSVHPLVTPSVTTTSDKLYRLEFSQENSFIYALSQQYDTSELAYCDGIACNYFRDPVGALGLHHAEMRFQTNTSSSTIEIQLREDASSNWITVASTANTSASESGGDISFRTYGGTDYSLRFEADSTSNDYSAIISLISTGSNEFSGITALGTWLCAPADTLGDERVFMSVSGMGTLIFKSDGSTVEYDLNNYVQNAVTFSGAESFMFELIGTSFYLDYQQNSRTYRVTPNVGTDCVYAVQMLLAASGMHNTPYKNMDDSARTAMMLVEGASQSSTPSIMWSTTDGQGFRPWEPWKEGGNSSGSSAGVYELSILDNGYDSGSRMLPLVSPSGLTDKPDASVLNWSIGTSTSNAQETSGMYTLVGNPIALYDSAYRAPDDSRIKGAVRVVDMHGKICWQRYSYTAKQWMIEENPSFYWQETNKSTTSIVAVLSYPGYGETSAILINNPLYAGQYNSRPCAVRPYISSDGTLLSWKRRTESGDWTDVKASGTSGTTASTTALCSYATILADRNAETADAVRKGITFGYHAGGDTTTLGYLQFADTLNSANNYKSIIAIEDLLWLGDNINKLKALVN